MSSRFLPVATWQHTGFFFPPPTDNSLWNRCLGTKNEFWPVEESVICLASFLTFFRFWLPRVFVTVLRLSLVVEWGGHSLDAWASYFSGFSCLRIQNVPQLSQHALPRGHLWFTKVKRSFNQLVVDTGKKRKQGHVFIELLRFSTYELESLVFVREHILGKIVRNHPALQVRRDLVVPSPWTSKLSLV